MKKIKVTCSSLLVFSVLVLTGCNTATAIETSQGRYEIIPWHVAEGVIFNHPIPPGFEFKYSSPRQDLHEYAPVEESVEKWSRLVTYTAAAKKQSFDGIAVFEEQLNSGFSKRCKKFKAADLEPATGGAVRTKAMVFSCILPVAGYDGDTEETLYVRFIDSQWGTFSQQYAFRKKAGTDISELSSEQKASAKQLFEVGFDYCQVQGEHGLPKCDKKTMLINK